MARVTISEDPAGTGYQIVAFIEKSLDVRENGSLMREAVKEMAKEFAGKWVEENRDKVIERLNVDAIANMVMLEVANDIKKDARKEEDSGKR